LRVTIWDVAREAAVSKSTVSNVLRGNPVVREDTRQAVLDAIERIGFRPNAAARTLVQRRSMTLGVVVSDIRDPFDGEIARSIAIASSAAGYATILSELTAPGRPTYLDLVPAGRADGLIFAGWPAVDSVLEQLVRTPQPIAFVSCRPIPGIDADSVNVDERVGVTLAIRHLVELGHRSIGCIARAEDQAAERVAGFRMAMADAGLTVDERLVIRTEPLGEDADLGTVAGSSAVAEILRADAPPTAIFAADDYLAMGAMQALEETGLGVPSHVSLVGFDDSRIAGLSRIGLTTVHQPRALMGRLVTQLLVSRLTAPGSKPPESVILEPELIVRSSTGPAPR
jgi:LacI family transcriptional regulator